MPLKNQISASRDIYEIGDSVTKRGERFFVVGRHRRHDCWTYDIISEAEYRERLIEKYLAPEPAPAPPPPPPRPWWRRAISWMEASWL